MLNTDDNTSSPIGGIASASMRDSVTNLTFERQEYIPPNNHLFSQGQGHILQQAGGAPIKCKGKSHSDCTKETCIWTSKGYCRKRGKMTCRGKKRTECKKNKIHIPTLKPSVVGRCKYTRRGCRRIHRYTSKGGRRRTVNNLHK